MSEHRVSSSAWRSQVRLAPNLQQITRELVPVTRRFCGPSISQPGPPGIQLTRLALHSPTVPPT
ncbi:MAG TPA: hypothetical protein VII84_10735, partial [Acidimicrobiales bacterium]